jgi:alpha-galactosidase
LVPHQENWDDLKQRLADYRKAADYFYGDYYPLTTYSRGRDVWMAWQFVRPEKGDGMVQIFRRDESPYQTAHLRLRGLKPAARYVFTDVDTGKAVEATGTALMDQGLKVEIAMPHSAVILTFSEENCIPRCLP